jgi:hypothetical protein
MNLTARFITSIIRQIMVGLAGKDLLRPKIIGLGALLGLIVSFAFYSSTGFHEVLSFLAGIVYGIVLYLHRIFFLGYLI